MINGKCMGEMNVMNGIRQGCTCFPQLFVLAVNEFIKGIQKSELRFRNDGVYVHLNQKMHDLSYFSNVFA